MEKMMRLRPLFRSLSCRSYHAFPFINHVVLRPSLISRSPNPLPSPSHSECMSPFSMGLGSMRFYSEDLTHVPNIKDPALYNAFKDLMAVSWSELPDSVVSDVKNVLSKNTDDKAGKEAVENVFRAAEAIEEFGGILVSLKLEFDDSIGLSGEDVKPLPDHIKNALCTTFDRYSTYLNSFGPDENYLRKKVETELGAKMIHLKMRCSGLGAEWGKVSLYILTYYCLFI
ncbi:Succinate dehydrogenase subunit 5, mitochondrial isoform C [Glycine soja]|uniref:Succinate dehydrogenase subunit 5, mitochondrial isoform C n=1 Tax=Glycine soja TaxID=3848 RepID=A0A445H367_GLYSO|nr:Succinate dehydrogenase subunit 5, mitochondrial isoform C [Glycine soja]